MPLTQLDLPEQLTFWNTWHRQRRVTGEDPVQVELRQLFLGRLPDAADVLDLGCGQGHDLRAMARAGHRVAGIDFSPVAIREARKKIRSWRFGRPGADLRVHNIADGLPFENQCFDGVYSHLSLHYFRDDATRSIFSEIKRILRPGGLLVFSVKSTDDPYYGKGERLGEHIYRRKGHVRHFFDEAYLKDLLDGWTMIEPIRSCRGHYACTEASAFIRAVARRAS